MYSKDGKSEVTLYCEVFVNMKNEVFEYEVLDRAVCTPVSFIDSFDLLLEETPMNNNLAVIQKWKDCSGRIVIPSNIDDQTIVFGISANAFVLTEKTESITIPSTVEHIDINAFNTDRLPAGVCPIIRINYKFDKRFVCKSLEKNGWRRILSDWAYSDFILKKCLIDYDQDGISFQYRKINSSEIEIVNWISPKENIIIPKQIDGDLTVASICSSAFIENPDLVRVIVPDTVRSIGGHAFMYINNNTYIYGDLYDPGWRESGKLPACCLIQLPKDLQSIEGNAFLRGTECSDRRHRRDSFDNCLVIAVPKDSATFIALSGLGWISKIETDEFAIMYLDEHNHELQSWLFRELFLTRKVVINRIDRTLYKDYLE